MDALAEALAGLPPFHHDGDIDAEWRTIASYDKGDPEAVLLRGAGQAVLGVWCFGYVHDGEKAVMGWRSAEDSTLDSPLWFEPEQFATLSDDDEQYYLRR